MDSLVEIEQLENVDGVSNCERTKIFSKSIFARKFKN